MDQITRDGFPLRAAEHSRARSAPRRGSGQAALRPRSPHLPASGHWPAPRHAQTPDASRSRHGGRMRLRAPFADTSNVNNDYRLVARTGVALLAVLLLAACAARPAPDFRGRWQPVNRFADAPVAIALQQQYLFYASPMDRTLKGMLERWAADAKMALSYQHPSDFTLHAAVATIRTPELASAAAQLGEAYAAQGVSVAVEGNRIVVRQGSTVVGPNASVAPPATGSGS